jgi:MFS family permease
MWVGVGGIAVLYVSSTLPTALYPLYEREFGFSELVVTAIYGSYVIGNLAVLLTLGRLSDQLGRRPASLLALAVVLASTICFLAARATGWLYAGRVLNGLAVGLGAGALTAWIAELEPSHDKRRAARLASAGNLAGLGVGPLLTGMLAQYAPAPLRTGYVVYLVVLLLTMALLGQAVEGVQHPVHRVSQLRLRPRIGIPRNIRLPFLAPAALAFAVFALGGFYGALTPGLLSHGLNQHSPAVLGAVVALFFGTGALAAAASGRVGDRQAMLLSTALLLTGLLLLLVAEWRGSLPWLLGATVVCGTAMALGYRCSLGMVNDIAPSEQRAELVSAYLLVCYTANSIPVVGVGLLSRLAGAPVAHLVFAVLLAALAVIACIVGWRSSLSQPAAV